MTKLWIRNDDILVHSKQHAAREFSRFKYQHELICTSELLWHTPAILTTEIQDFPECIQYVKEEAAAGRMNPQLHGLNHIDYASLPKQHCKADLQQAIEWMQVNLNVTPTHWYTPFGAGADERGKHLKDIAASLDMKLVAVSNGHNEIRNVSATKEISCIINELRDGKSFVDIMKENAATLIHWWQSGSKLERLVECAKHGSYANATVFNRKLFK